MLSRSSPLTPSPVGHAASPSRVRRGLLGLALAAVAAALVLGVLGVAPGVAGPAVAAGPRVVGRPHPPGQCGMALPVFGAGMGIAAALALVGRHLVTADRRHGLL